MLSRITNAQTWRSLCSTIHGVRRCTRAYSIEPIKHNEQLISVLEKQRRDLIATPGYDRPLLMGYTTAINRIRGHDKPITHIDEAVAVLKNVVRSVVGRVVIYLQTGQTNMPDDEEMRKTDMMTNAVRVLSRIVGIGQKTAMELASKGCYTVEQLREPQFYKMLQKRSQTALDWQDVVDAEASEEQAEAVAQFIRDNISSKFETVLVGSHRRNQTSKIINILLFHPGHVHIPTPSDNVFTVFKKPTRGNTSEGRIIMAPNVLQPLRDRGLIVGEMSQGVRLWTGIVRVPKREGVDVWEGRWARLNAIQAREGVYRRVEISMAPWKSRGAALLGSTGDRKFIMDMRYSAEKLGMRLDEFGLWRWIEDPNDAIASHPSTSALTNAELPLPGGKSKGYWVLVAGETEESIFEELNRPFVEPSKRNFGFLKDNGSTPRLRDVVNTRQGRPRTNELLQPQGKRKLGRPKSVGLATSTEETEPRRP